MCSIPSDVIIKKFIEGVPASKGEKMRKELKADTKSGLTEDGFLYLC